MRIFKRAALVLLVTGSWGMLPEVAAQDDPTPNPSEILVDGQQCTLSDAITAANSNRVAGGCIAGNATGDGADVIRLTQSIYFDPLTNGGLPPILTTITIEGNNFGVGVFAELYQLLEVVANADPNAGRVGEGKLTLRNLVLGSGGTPSLAVGIINRGGVLVTENVSFHKFHKGAIRSEGGTLQLTNTYFVGNRADSGAAIFATNAEVTLEGGSFTDNWADAAYDFDGIGGLNGGGALHFKDSTFHLAGGERDLIFENNRAYGLGGAIWSENSTGAIHAAQFKNNEAGSGGAIYHGVLPTLTLAITDSQFIGNRVTDSLFQVQSFGAEDGGAIFNGGYLSVQRSLFWGNIAGSGGAIAGTLIPSSAFDGQTTGVLLMESSTLIGNSAKTGGAIWLGYMGGQFINTTIYGNVALEGYGGGVVATYKTYLHNSIVVANLGGDCFGVTEESWSDTGVTNTPEPFSGSNNRDSDDTCPDGEIISGLETIPLNNGNSTISLALLEGSNAIDAGDAEYCPTHDQRGAEIVGPCDIGAFEFDAMELPVIRDPDRIGDEERRVEGEQAATERQLEREQAFNDLTAQIEADPNNAELYYQRGMLIAQTDPDASLADLAKALELDPQMAKAQLQITATYLYLYPYQSCERATAELAIYKELAPDDTRIQGFERDLAGLCGVEAEQAAAEGESE